MKVTKEQREENRFRLLDAAAKLFKERGIGAVSVGEIAEAAGLTHGALYRHFPSKEKIAEATTEYVFNAATDRIVQKRDEVGWNLRDAMDSYLSPEHLMNRAGGCPSASLGIEVAGCSTEIRQAFERGFQKFILEFSALPNGHESRRDEAIMAYASGIGTMILARAVKDPALAKEILSVGRRHLPAQPGSSGMNGSGASPKKRTPSRVRAR